jgi:hypothetical protein
LRYRIYICAVLAVTSAATLPADARPLSREECDTLSAELDVMAKTDVPNAVLRGPEWAIAHMPQAMEQVKRYLLVEEQLRFRCTGKRVPDLEPEVAGTPAKAKPAKADSRASLEAEMSTVLSDANRNQGGDVPDARQVKTRAPAPVAPVNRNVQGTPAAASAAGGRAPGLDSAYRQLFPMGR